MARPPKELTKLDMPFNEALERLARVTPKELAAEIDKGKNAKKPKPPRKT
jgi:hypothetical protein